MPIEDSSVPSFYGQGNDSPCYSPLLSSVCSNPAGIFLLFHVFFSFFSALFDVFELIFFIIIGVDLFIGFLLERHVAVLVFV